jgi:hypothetical protein
MLIMTLSAASVLALAAGLLLYRRSVLDPANDAMGRAMAFWFAIAGEAVGLVPALIAAGLTLARYDRLDGPTRLVGLAPAVVLILLPLPFVAIVAWDLVARPVIWALKERGRKRR